MEWSSTPSAKLTVGEHELEYACWGPAPSNAPTLVMLHEGLGSVSLWRDTPERVAQETGCSVFTYSRAGYGRSSGISLPRPLDYMSREATEVFPGVLDAIGGESVILLGHSDGATIAAMYAGSVSDARVRGLILIAPHFFTEPDGLGAIAASKSDYETGDLKQRLAKYHDHPDQAFYGWHDAWTDPKFQDWHAGDEIDHWRIPCLAIQGEQDPYGTAAQIEEIETRIYAPFDAVMLPNCGHAPHLEKPELTLQAISEFVSRLSRLEAEHVAIA
ncbi:MAG: alpha/beta hydrolase [Rhodobacteraceae bacterium]|nr:alpha/beta hydrolase [Paracoccaceae bacterium]